MDWSDHVWWTYFTIPLWFLHVLDCSSCVTHHCPKVHKMFMTSLILSLSLNVILLFVSLSLSFIWRTSVSFLFVVLKTNSIGFLQYFCCFLCIWAVVVEISVISSAHGQVEVFWLSRHLQTYSHVCPFCCWFVS